MDSTTNGSGINIKDLVFVLLKRVWIMLIAGSVLGLALGVYKIENRAKTYDVLDVNTKLSSSETDVQYQLRVQNISKARSYVELISRANLLIDYQRQYLSDSIYMQINPENEYLSTAQITLTLNNNDSNGMDSALFSAYEREVKAANYLDDYANSINVRPEYIKELISFSSSKADNVILSDDEYINSIGSMYITVVGPSRELCDDVMDLVIENINNTYKELNASVTPHSISVVGIQQQERIDDGLRTYQNNMTTKIDSLQKQIVSYNEAIDKIAKELGLSGKEVIFEYFGTHSEEYLDGIPTATSEKSVSRKSMLKPGLKYAALGFIIGFAGVAAIFIVLYIFGKRFSTQAQFFAEYPFIRKIGVMKPTSKRSKFSGFIDVKSGDDSKLTRENNIKYIKYNYENLISNKKKVLITGVGDINVMSEAIKSLGINGDFKPDMFNNPEVIKELKDYDGVVLLEQRKSSLYRNITDEILLIKNAQIDIVGAIII